jgi:CubicO group peptidase (beta-lactamase class C family)
MTKSFTSTCLGLLIDEGKCTIDTLAHEHVPAMKALYPSVQLRHFTTMTSGYRAEGDSTSGSYTHGPSSTPFQPAEPLFTPPGSHYAYWDSAMNQFANVLTQIAQEPLIDYFKRKIADPIQMNPDGWKWGDFDKVDGITINGGAGNNGKHIQINAREAARFGHLFLNNGNWNGKQLISQEWVEQAQQTQVNADIPMANPELSSAEGPGVYGYNWWNNGTKANGEHKLPGAPKDTYFASGFNNNPITDEEFGTFFEMLGEAVKE